MASVDFQKESSLPDKRGLKYLQLGRKHQEARAMVVAGWMWAVSF